MGRNKGAVGPRKAAEAVGFPGTTARTPAAGGGRRRRRRLPGAGRQERPPLQSHAPATGQWAPGMLAGGRRGRAAAAGAGWRRALPLESDRAGGGGAMEGLEGEEAKGCGPGG